VRACERQAQSITERIAVARQAGRKLFTLQTLPACDEPFDDGWARWPRALAACGRAGRAFAVTLLLLNVISNMPAVMLRASAGERFAGPMLALGSTLAANHLTYP
jgi:hypothetical protein